ncbi:hypothetical protein [Pleionea sp. CnH1-48]|uniref:hypothetical protein n=1 Tax=Pleionea sp. CnH1-48 TaxID=2954494 RepID=UPI002098193F|nr:hypothetical protein [Pleionea sp. CnH1-48]MCO7227022.1 hypothetical protein [Pleionea sp. CnH1-48]
MKKIVLTLSLLLSLILAGCMSAPLDPNQRSQYNRLAKQYALQCLSSLNQKQWLAYARCYREDTLEDLKSQLLAEDASLDRNKDAYEIFANYIASQFESSPDQSQHNLGMAFKVMSSIEQEDGLYLVVIKTFIKVSNARQQSWLERLTLERNDNQFLLVFKG